jgi:hypothetical protein
LAKVKDWASKEMNKRGDGEWEILVKKIRSIINLELFCHLSLAEIEIMLLAWAW